MGIFLFKIDIQGSSVSVIFIIIIIIIIIIIVIIIIIIFIAGTVLLHSWQKTHLANTCNWEFDMLLLFVYCFFTHLFVYFLLYSGYCF